MVVIRKELPEDIDAIRYVNEQAFGQKDEAGIVKRLRDANKVVVSLVAVEGDRVVGHILFSPATLETEGSNLEAVALGPIAVLPSHQEKGIGSELMRAGLDECRRVGHGLVFLVGHPDYYPRFGFVRARPAGIDHELEVPEEAWMFLELREGALAGRRGTVRFQPEFQEGA